MNQLWLFDVSHVDHSRKSEKGSHLFCLQHICWVIIALCTARWKKCREGRWSCRPTWPPLKCWGEPGFFRLKDLGVLEPSPFCPEGSGLLQVISLLHDQLLPKPAGCQLRAQKNFGFNGIQHDLTNKNMGM